MLYIGWLGWQCKGYIFTRYRRLCTGEDAPDAHQLSEVKQKSPGASEEHPLQLKVPK